MAATSAGHLQPQHQHQPTQQQQQKMNTANTMNGSRNRNSPQQQSQQQPQIHNLQQQQHLMQQYALKQQQQHNYNMQQQHLHQQQMMQQQQQQMHQQHMQQQEMHLKMQQQQQQMFHNQSSQDSVTHMMPCQNYMTPMPQTQSKFDANNCSGNAQQMSHYQNYFFNNQRSMQQSGNLPAGLVNGNTNSQNPRNNRSTCIPPNVVAPSANQNIYPHQNISNSNMMQQHNLNNHNANIINQRSSHYNQQQQQTFLQNQQKHSSMISQADIKNDSHNNSRPQLHVNDKQHVASEDNSICNTNCNTNCDSNLSSNHFNTSELDSNSNNINNNNQNHSMPSGVKANIPPGWRRLTNNNNEIVYISPTGSTLRSPFQIKDYLLSPGTCKCGLPCPLQPEYFFDFNVQVPNSPLTMPTYQNNDFNSSSSNSLFTTESTTSTTMSSSPSPSLHASCSMQQQAAMTTSTVSSGAFVVPPMDTSSSSSSSSSLSSSSFCSTTTAANIPSATSPSSLTCLHLKRFLDSQQLHAHPMESFNKDAKRRKIANGESILENNNGSATANLIPATATQTVTTDSKLIFATDSSGEGEQPPSSHNSTFKIHPPSLQQQEQQQLTNHHQQQQQKYVITNSTHGNNSMLESANKTWPKDDRDRMLPSTSATLTQHESTSSHMMNDGIENIQWSSNLGNKPQGVCQTKQLTATTATTDANNKEQQHQRQQLEHTSLYKNDLNGYLQQQTTLVHNSIMNLENCQGQSVLDEDDADIEDDEVDDEQEEGEEEMELDDEEEEEEDENEKKGNLIEQLEESGVILNRKKTLADCISNEELEEEIDEENSVGNFNENDEADEEDDDELEPDMEDDDKEQEEEEEKEDNNCETQTIATEQTVIDKSTLNISNDTRLFNTNSTINFYQMPNSANQSIKQHHFTSVSNITPPSQTSNTNKVSFNALKTSTQSTHTQQQLQQNMFKHQQQQHVRTPIKLVPTAQESPVSSSTVGGPRSTPDLQRKTPDNTKKPEQVGAISTSNESPKPCPSSPASTIESTNTKISISKAAASPALSTITTLHLKPQQQGSLQKSAPQQVRILRHIKNAGSIQQVTQQPHRLVTTNTSRATVTTIAGSKGAATTTTTTSSSAHRNNPTILPSVNQKIQATVQKVTANSTNSTNSIPISQLHLQPLLRSNDNTGNSQIIMTSTGQLIVMPSSNAKPQLQQQQQQVIIASGNATATTQSNATTNVIIQQQGTQQMDVLNNTGQLTTATLQQQSNGGYIVSQATNTQGTAAQLQPTTVILNSAQNLITSNGAKVLTNTGNIIHAAGTQPIITTASQLLTTPSNAGNTTNMLGQQTVVLNALPNGGYVIQQQPQATQTAVQPQQQQYTAALDSQVVQHLVQQPDGRIIITSHSDPKRRPKKRKTSPSPTANNTTQISPAIQNQTATLIQQHVANLQAAAQNSQPTNQPQVVQLTTAPAVNAATTATYPQQFQLGNGIQGIVVNKPASTATATQPQQILLQNGQIIQPMNLIGQQLILPSGLVMAPDTTLLQIQNVGSCGPTTNILTTTPQGTMMLRATSPQTNKQFIQSTTTGQQFIVGSNGQLSPIGQIYSTPMGLVMPASTQHNPTATATFVQQNATIQVAQPHHQQVSTPQHITLHALQQHQQNQLNQHQQQQQHHVVNNQVGIVLEPATSSTTSPNGHLANSRSSAASPPDTTTHSPRSSDTPPSHRSGGSDMVQCVSSSEPDGGTISPLSTDSRQSPSTTVCDKGIVMSTAYQNTNIYKPIEAKIRRVQTPPQYQVVGGGTTTATHITGLTNLTLQQQQQHNTTNNSQHHHADNGNNNNNSNNNNNKPDTHDSPQNSPSTTLMITPPPPRTPTPQQNIFHSSPTTVMEYQQQTQQQQQQQQQQLKTTFKNCTVRNRNRSVKNPSRGGVKITEIIDATTTSPSSSSPPLAASLQRTFSVGELIWGPARGFPAWPGKVVKIIDNQPESVWVQWFGGGGRSNTEIMAINLLQSLSEGLEAHHKAQKDTRKSRKLNSQLEKAIQEAMTELDRISASSTTTTGSAKQIQQPTSSTQHQNSPSRANKRPIPRTGGYDLIAGLNNNNTSSNVISTTTGSSQPRHKPIRIAPAPPGGTGNSPTKSSSSTTTTTQMVNSSSSTSASSK